MTPPPLVPCPACSRHVRATEPACPFCGAPPPFGAPRPTVSARLTRVAAFSLGATLAAAGCNHDSLPIEPTDASTPDLATPDLATPDLAVVDAAPPGDLRDGGPADLKGADLATGPDFSSVPLYGAPPPRDGG